MLPDSEMELFLIFSKFLKEFIYKEIQKIWNYQLDEHTTLLLAYSLASKLLHWFETITYEIVFDSEQWPKKTKK